MAEDKETKAISDFFLNPKKQQGGGTENGESRKRLKWIGKMDEKN